MGADAMILLVEGDASGSPTLQNGRMAGTLSGTAVSIPLPDSVRVRYRGSCRQCADYHRDGNLHRVDGRKADSCESRSDIIQSCLEQVTPLSLIAREARIPYRTQPLIAFLRNHWRFPPFCGRRLAFPSLSPEKQLVECWIEFFAARRETVLDLRRHHGMY
jgi:hypothetical protein